MIAHPILDELAEVCGLEIPPCEGEELEAFLKDVVLPKASELPDNQWTAMSDQTQLWTVSAFEKANEGSSLPPLGDLTKNWQEATPLNGSSPSLETQTKEAAPATNGAAGPAPQVTLTKRRGPAGGRSHANSDVITVLHLGENPKRAGTISWQEWEELRDGMTVAEFLQTVTAKGANPRRAELNGWVKQGLIRIAPEV